MGTLLCKYKLLFEIPINAATKSEARGLSGRRHSECTLHTHQAAFYILLLLLLLGGL